jgi:class 3 adenylate cyclase
MQRKLESLNENWAKCGIPKVKIGIGIATGEAIVGNIGSDKKMEYTAIGQNAILAQRIEKLTKQFPYDILIDESTFYKAQEDVEMGVCPPYPKIFVEKFGPIYIEGKKSPIAVYGVKVPEYTVK